MRLAVLALLVSAPVWAEKSTKIQRTDLTVIADGGGVEIRRGKASIRVPIGARHPDLAIDVEAHALGDEVAITVSTNCSGDFEIRMALAAIDARFAAASGDWPRAAALDPTWDEAEVQLAKLRAKEGKLDEAKTILRALAPRRPDLAALAVAGDPALSELADLVPPRGKLRGKRSGVVYSPALHLVAYTDNMGNSMSEEDRTPSTLYVIDARTGKELDARTARRSSDTEVFYETLGFEVVPLVEIPTGDDGKTRVVLPSKIGVVLDPKNNRARVLRGNKILGEAGFAWDHQVAAGQTADGVVVVARENIGDGCGGWDYDRATFIPIRP